MLTLMISKWSSDHLVVAKGTKRRVWVDKTKKIFPPTRKMKTSMEMRKKKIREKMITSFNKTSSGLPKWRRSPQRYSKCQIQSNPSQFLWWLALFTATLKVTWKLCNRASQPSLKHSRLSLLRSWSLAQANKRVNFRAIKSNGLQIRTFSNRRRHKAVFSAWAGRQSPGIRCYWLQPFKTRAISKSWQ